MYIFITVIITITLSSIVEGLFHQFILHTAQKRLLGGALEAAFEAHALDHHPSFRDDKYYHEATSNDKRISLEWYMLPALLVMFSPVGAGAWWLWGMWAGLSVYFTIIAYYAAYEFFHWNMHFPGKDERGRLFRRYQPLKAIFEWFDKRHFIHHLADDRNYNVVLPIYDLATGTYTTDPKRQPWAIRLRTARAMRKSTALRRSLGK